MPDQIRAYLVSGIVVAVSFGAPPLQAGETMNAAELLATIPGATLTGISNEDLETRWVQVYETGTQSGSSAGTFGADDQYVSQWSVRRDLWCEDWGHRAGCWKIERIDEDTLQPYRGTEKLPNVWKILRRADAMAPSN